MRRDCTKCLLPGSRSHSTRVSLKCVDAADALALSDGRGGLKRQSRRCQTSVNESLPNNRMPAALKVPPVVRIFSPKFAKYSDSSQKKKQKKKIRFSESQGAAVVWHRVRLELITRSDANASPHLKMKPPPTQPTPV